VDTTHSIESSTQVLVNRKEKGKTKNKKEICCPHILTNIACGVSVFLALGPQRGGYRCQGPILTDVMCVRQ